MVVQSQFIEMFGTISGNTPLSLGDFFSMKAGKSITAEDIKLDQEEDLYPCYGGNGVRGYVTSYTHEGDTVLIGRQGALCGNVQIARNKFYATEHAVVVTPKTPVNISWLYYALKSMELNQYARGVAQPGLAVGQLEKLPFVLPSMKSQNEFARVSHQADKSKFDGLKSQFIEMFGNPVTNPMGWSTKPLCQVAPESPSNTKMKGRIWVLNLDMIESNSGCIINKVFEDSDDLNSVAAFDEGNVLFSKLRPYLNKVTIPDGKGYATTELVPLRPHTDELRQHFLSFLLRTDEFVKYADGIATGTKMPRMPMTALREFKCILPSTELQDLFCGISKQADKSKYLS